MLPSLGKTQSTWARRFTSLLSLSGIALCTWTRCCRGRSYSHSETPRSSDLLIGIISLAALVRFVAKAGVWERRAAAGSGCTRRTLSDTSGYLIFKPRFLDVVPAR